MVKWSFGQVSPSASTLGAFTATFAFSMLRSTACSLRKCGSRRVTSGSLRRTTTGCQTPGTRTTVLR